jgi:hypothetical protein
MAFGFRLLAYRKVAHPGGFPTGKFFIMITLGLRGTNLMIQESVRLYPGNKQFAIIQPEKYGFIMKPGFK